MATYEITYGSSSFSYNGEQSLEEGNLNEDIGLYNRTLTIEEDRRLYSKRRQSGSPLITSFLEKYQ